MVNAQLTFIFCQCYLQVSDGSGNILSPKIFELQLFRDVVTNLICIALLGKLTVHYKYGIMLQ